MGPWVHGSVGVLSQHGFSRPVIRRAIASDLPALGRLGAALMRQHHDYDPQRFMSPGDGPEDGYAWFLGTQLEHDDVAIFVADHDGAVVGYAYAGLEPQSWKELREACGYVHDLVVDAARPKARRRHRIDELGARLAA